MRVKRENKKMHNQGQMGGHGGKKKNKQTGKPRFKQTGRKKTLQQSVPAVYLGFGAAITNKQRRGHSRGGPGRTGRVVQNYGKNTGKS